MKTIQINPLDNVAVALTPIPKGESVTAGEYTVIAGGDIPQGHKNALKKIQKDTNIIKNSFPIVFLIRSVHLLFPRPHPSICS